MSDNRIYRPKKPKEKGPPALDLLDEAFHRLRAAPLGVLGIYYFGSLPFVLGLLYFWADLSHSADAERYGTGAALGLGLLFLWMKFCHADFARRLRAMFSRRPPPPWSARRLVDFLVVQSVMHSAGLFVLLVAAVVTVPAGWAYAFCQSATAIGAGETGTVREVFRRALRAALLWPKQNHLMLLIVSVLGLFVWFNILAAVLGLPYLLKMITGEENVFTRGGMDLFNSTFIAVTLSLAYLVLDPVIKTFYVLRCFYADSLYTGEDLRSELHTLPVVKATPVTTSVATLAVVLLLGCLLLPIDTQAAPAPGPLPAVAPAAPEPGPNIRPLELDKSIEQVMHRREFAWRVPPATQTVAPPENSFFSNAARWLGDAVSAIFRPIGHAWTAFRDWFHALKEKWHHDHKDAPPVPTNESGGFNGGGPFLRSMLYVLIAVILALVLYEGWKAWRRRKQSPELAGRAASSGALAVSDLSNDEVLATQLPEDEWMQLARRLRESGEHRLALRAFYLSILSLLGARGLLAVARHKSNRDYLAELRRRARDRSELQNAFTRNVSRYERVWYGPHPASEELFEQFLADRQVICSDAVPTQALPATA